MILFALRPTSTQLAVAAKFEQSLASLLRERAECRSPEDEEDIFEVVVLEKCLQSVVNRVRIGILSGLFGMLGEKVMVSFGLAESMFDSTVSSIMRYVICCAVLGPRCSLHAHGGERVAGDERAQHL